jgi:hypothetical protein
MKPLVLALCLTLPLAVGASPVLLDFDGSTNGAFVNDFYNGGTDSIGGVGANYGVAFSANAQVIADGATSGSNIAGEPSAPNVLYFTAGSQLAVNVVSGFESRISFFNSSAFGGAAELFAGLDGTGALLGSINYDATDASACPADSYYCHWTQVDLDFAGTARSLVFSDTAGYALFDNISLQTVPEPPMLLLTASALLLALRRPRRRPSH